MMIDLGLLLYGLGRLLFCIHKLICYNLFSLLFPKEVLLENIFYFHFISIFFQIITSALLFLLFFRKISFILSSLILIIYFLRLYLFGNIERMRNILISILPIPLFLTCFTNIIISFIFVFSITLLFLSNFYL